MAEHSVSEDEPVASVQDLVIDHVTASQQEALQTVEIAGRALFSNLTRVQSEIAAFVSERIRQDLDTQSELIRCRNLSEVRDVQSRFFRAAVDQYARETTRLMRLGSEIAAGAGRNLS